MLFTDFAACSRFSGRAASTSCRCSVASLIRFESASTSPVALA